MCKRIIAQAVLVSLRQKQVVTTSKFSCSSPCSQECTEEQIMQVPVLQIIEICRNHMPVLYVAFRLRSPRTVEVPNMQVVVGALFLNFGLTHWMPAAGYTYWAHAQGLVLAEISSLEIVALVQKTYLSSAESRHGSWSCRELGNPPMLSGASRT